LRSFASWVKCRTVTQVRDRGPFSKALFSVFFNRISKMATAPSLNPASRHPKIYWNDIQFPNKICFSFTFPSVTPFTLNRIETVPHSYISRRLRNPLVLLSCDFRCFCEIFFPPSSDLRSLSFFFRRLTPFFCAGNLSPRSFAVL